MRDWPKMLREFHAARGEHAPARATPNIMSAVRVLRLRLMMEELGELAVAMHDGSLVDVADALCDLLYVVVGTADVYGLGPCLDDLFAEVHRSNMTKSPPHGAAGASKYGSRGKGPNYDPPRLQDIIALSVK